MSLNRAINPLTLPASAGLIPPATAPGEIPGRILDCEAEGTLYGKGSGAGPINVLIPWFCELTEMVVHSQGVHASGTCQAKHGVGGTAITDAVVAAAANTVIRAATIDPAQSRFIPGETISLAFTNTPDVRVALKFKRQQTLDLSNADGS